MARFESRILVVSFGLCLVVAQASVLFSQSITGDILGTVQDPTGALVPAAKVTLTAVGTGVTLTTTTDQAGNYLFAELKPGHYRLEASKEGFQTTTISDVELLVGQRPRVDIALQVGAVTQTVEVSAGGVQLLETQTSSMGQVVQGKPIEELPLNRRNFMQLTTLSAGVAPIGTGVSPASFWTGAGSGQVTASVAGLRESNESFLVNGIETRNARFGSVGLRPSIDAIQEFKMQTSSFSAEFGRSSAVINTTLKSGTNTIHGSAYEFLRNSALDANSFFLNSANRSIPPFQQNNFGGSFGGPVVIPHLYNGRDKTFFFLNYEGLRSRRGLSGTALLPSRAQLAGRLADDSAGTGIIPTKDPFCLANPTSPKCFDLKNPFTGQPVPGNDVSSLLDPVAQKWLPFIPAPNVAVAAGQSKIALFNYTISPKNRDDFNQGNVRVDQKLTSKDQIFGSYSFEDRPHVEPAVMPLQGLRFPLRNQVVAITESRIFSPSTVNEFRFGYNRSKTFLVSEGALGKNYAVDVFGFKNTSPNPFDFGVPTASLTDFQGIGSHAESIGALDEDYQFVDNLSKVQGAHNIKVGANIIREKFFQITDFGGIPSFNFNGRFTGKGLGDFVLGAPFTAITSVGDSSQNLRTTWYAGYLQDDWRARPGLSLNFGLRYEHATTPYDLANRTQWFDPAVRRPVTSKSGGVRNGIVDPDWNDFGPRVGFAYSPRFVKNSVFRGSFGIFYATDNWNELQFLVIGPDFFSSQTLNSDPAKPTISLANIFPAGALGGGTGNPFSIDKRNRTPYVQEWALDFQHTFGQDLLVDVGYIGNTGQKLLQRRNQNIRTEDPTGTIPIKQREPYPEFSWILVTYGGGWSSYNGLTARVEKRLSGGLYLLGSYTWSHGIDLGGTDEFSASSARFKVLDKGNSTFDVRHRVAISYLYELPLGRNKRLLSGASGVVDRLVGGWKFNGITTFSTGQYKTAGLPFDWPTLGVFSQSRPDQVGNPYPANQTFDNWLNLSAFVAPGCPSVVTKPNPNPSAAPGLLCENLSPGRYVQGNSARNSLRMPGINNWDFALLKDTRVSERFLTQFRAEFFNGWNHTQFGDASTSLTPGEFGRITSLRIDPRVVQFGLKVIF